MKKPKYVEYLKSLEINGKLTDRGREFYRRLKEIRNNKEKCKCGNNTVTEMLECDRCFREIPKERIEFLWLHSLLKRGYIKLDSNLRYNKTFCLCLAFSRGDPWLALRYYFHKKQKGLCMDCKKEFDLDNMELHHIVSKFEGGIEEEKNLKLLCKQCHYKYTFSPFWA